MAITIGFIEAISYLFDSKFMTNQNIKSPPSAEVIHSFRKYNVDYYKIENEMHDLYYGNSPIFHPYGWYMLEPNFNGIYVKTDKYVFRNSRKDIKENTTKIACFGGSTMFSTITADNGTIP